MAQDFANKQATAKVMSLFEEMLQNLMQSRADADETNRLEIESFNKFLEVSQKTITDAHARIDKNTAELEVVNKTIQHQEELRDIAAKDRDEAQEDLDEETARWAKAQAAYEALIAQLKKELGAIDQVIELFSSA